MALWHYQSRFSVCNLLPLIAQLIQPPLDCFCGKVSGMPYIFTSIAENRYSHSYSRAHYSYSHTRSLHSHHYSHHRRTPRHSPGQPIYSFRFRFIHSTFVGVGGAFATHRRTISDFRFPLHSASRFSGSKQRREPTVAGVDEGALHA